MTVLDMLRAHEHCAAREQELRQRAARLVNVLQGDLAGEELYDALNQATEDLAAFLVELDDRPDKAPKTQPRKTSTPTAFRRPRSSPESGGAGKADTPSTKVCPGCDRRLAADKFGRHAKTRDGLQPRCRDCKGATMRAAKSRDQDATAAVQKPSTNPDALVAVCPTHGEVERAARNGQDAEGWLLMARSRHHHTKRCAETLTLEGAS